jgi:hypothetical protein
MAGVVESGIGYREALVLAGSIVTVEIADAVGFAAGSRRQPECKSRIA